MTDDIREAPTLTINGAPVAVVTVEPTEAMIEAAGNLGVERAPAKWLWKAMLSAADPALTDAVVEMREALVQALTFVEYVASEHKGGVPDRQVAERCRAALARLEVSR